MTDSLLFGTTLIQKNVVDVKGRKVGKITDLLVNIDVNPWTVEKIKVLTGMIIMRKHVLIDVGMVKKVSDDAVMLKVEKGELKKKPKKRSLARELGRLTRLE